MLLHVVDVKPVGAIGVFKMKEFYRIKDTVCINLFAINSAGDSCLLAIGYNVFGMVEIQLNGPAVFLVDIKPDPVIVLRNGYIQWLFVYGIEIRPVGCFGFMHCKIGSIVHVDMNIASRIPLGIVTPLQVHAIDQFVFFLFLCGCGEGYKGKKNKGYKLFHESSRIFSGAKLSYKTAMQT